MTSTNRSEDIYDISVFSISNFHDVEISDKDPFKKCRWSKGLFYISQKKLVNNICIEFRCNHPKKLIVFIDSNDKKNLKFEFNLACEEYVLYIPITNDDNLTFYTEGVVPHQTGDTRELGLFVRNIFESNIKYGNISLFQSENFVFDINNDKRTELEEISISQQNSTVKVLDLNCSKSNLNFNSCIFNLENDQYLMTRKSSYIVRDLHINTLNLYKFDKNIDAFSKIDIKIYDELEYEQYEDPRVFLYNDKIYVSCANYVHHEPKLIHQKILVFDKCFNHIENIHPEYGFNGGSINQNTGQEKNWTYFVFENRLMCVYKMYPHVVVEFDWSGKLIAEYKTYFNINKIWTHGECRGGTNPIYKDGYYYGFFHSSMPWKNWKRRYLMGYYKFESKPPFKIVEISEKPIIWGNEIDERLLPDLSPLVVFPCGAIVENDQFLVSFGFNDEKTGIIRI